MMMMLRWVLCLLLSFLFWGGGGGDFDWFVDFERWIDEQHVLFTISAVRSLKHNILLYFRRRFIVDANVLLAEFHAM